MKMKGAIRWNLKVIMDRCQIGTVQLAAFMKVSSNVVSKWRRTEFLPQITEKRYIQIYNAINELCDLNGTPNRKIKLADLVEFCDHEVRDIDPLEYQYASGDARKKPKSKKLEEEMDDSTKQTIAA
jgi:hypothetical protein